MMLDEARTCGNGLKLMIESDAEIIVVTPDHALAIQALLAACPQDAFEEQALQLLREAPDDDAREAMVALMEVWQRWHNSDLLVCRLDNGKWRASCAGNAAEGYSAFGAVINLRDKLKEAITSE